VAPIDWQPWHTTAFLEAQRRRRPVLLLLETAWAPACARVHAEVFARPDVAAAIAETTIAVRVDADRRPDIADRYGLGHWPSLLVLTPEGHVLTGGTQLDEALAARIRAAAGAFAEHHGHWTTTPPVVSVASELDQAAAVESIAAAILSSRDPQTGACMQPSGPSAGATLFALAHATVRADPGWAAIAADTIDALPLPSMADDASSGAVALFTGRIASTSPAGFEPTGSLVVRLEEQAEWTRALARAVLLEPLPEWTHRLDRLVHGLRVTHLRDDHHWRPWTRASGIVLVDASARACRALLAAAAALDRPELARDAIDALEVLAPTAYARGAGVAHVLQDGHARGPMLLDDALLLGHALLDADAWRDGPVYRDLAEELLLTTLARLRMASGALGDRVAALAGGGQVGRLAEPWHPLIGNAAAASLLCRLFPDDAASEAEAHRILRAVTADAVAAGAAGAPVGLAWHALGPAGAVTAAW
jgi:uncharacterized protein YyaL (SSP411 family)